LRKADERATEIRQKYEELVKSHNDSMERMKRQDSMIESRDNEILRLGELYQGGQNLPLLNMKY
jgi:hypothetical protein